MSLANHTQAKEIAHLINADLLDALKEALTDLELSHMTENDEQIRVELKKTIIKARNAIKKATGGK